ncbi:MAG TPA: enoyl-CoA hydratase-related protein [Acidimicrobiia bacterium]|nr:enoyl-CoA hydratase-related protein [Acidimicrobiia bacterium]
MSPTRTEPVQLDIVAGIARLTLNRPDASNAISVELAASLADATNELVVADGIRAVLLRGAGPRFCAGGDVKAFAATGDALGEHLGAVLDPLHRAVSDLAELDAPVVAAVHGSAAGAGFSLVLGADLVVAGASTRFVLAYTGIGLVPDGGSTWYLTRLVGLRRATELALTNRVLTAEEALAWGIVTRVVSDDTVEAESEALVAQLATGPTEAFAETKGLLRRSLQASLPDQLGDEAIAMVRAGSSSDGQEGVRAFVEKRAPQFDGRDDRDG